MPIYEYECLECENSFEKLILGQSTGEIACPECSSLRVEQLFSGFAARTTSSDGSTRSLSSGCSGCTASSCAGCK